MEHNTQIDQSVEMPLSAEQYASYFIRLIFSHFQCSTLQIDSIVFGSIFRISLLFQFIFDFLIILEFIV